MAAASIVSALAKLRDDVLAESSKLDEASRVHALQSAQNMVNALTKPEEIVTDISYLPAYALAARLAIQLNLFVALVDADRPKTTAEIASATGSDEILVLRILRILAGLNCVKETGKHTFQANNVTRAWAQEPLAAGHVHYWDQGVNAMAKMPSFIEERGRAAPTDPLNGLYQYAFGTTKETFSYWTTQPKVFANFNKFFEGVRAARQSWVEWYPVQEEIIDGTKREGVVLVDVGGSRGFDLMDFQKKFPQDEGRLVLQDLPEVIDAVTDFLDPKIRKLAHDFFTEQPVKGARVYYLSHICHDWSNEPAQKILENLKPAMVPGYSKLLLNEFILPDTQCPLYPAGMDFMMMAMHAGMERTESQWKELLEESGYELVKLWQPSGIGEGIVEARLKTQHE